ncbi:hypothetical protein [Candidatus Odyssella acanthamoebae]|uniref:COG4648 family protein n=1 Tax=Candidatus Odyssella acanthamoebae TaxID=91604 RepID=UPI00068AAB99|nr:hypothetical protein [Candidatus Paracaedibacter acanthamoebae]
MSTKNKAKLLRRLWGGISLTYPALIYLYLKETSVTSIIPLLYPMAINLMVAGSFGMSLLYPPSMIERIARRMKHDLDERGIVYTRQVTKIWFGFCLMNAGVSLLTALYGDVKIWALYNGFISYILMGSLFIVEYSVRQYRRRHNLM